MRSLPCTCQVPMWFYHQQIPCTWVQHQVYGIQSDGIEVNIKNLLFQWFCFCFGVLLFISRHFWKIFYFLTSKYYMTTIQNTKSIEELLSLNIITDREKLSVKYFLCRLSSIKIWTRYFVAAEHRKEKKESRKWQHIGGFSTVGGLYFMSEHS